MTETIFGKNVFDVYFDFLVWPMSHLLTWRGPPGTRKRSDVLASLLGSSHVVHVYIQSMSSSSFMFNGQIWEGYWSSHATLCKNVNECTSQNVKLCIILYSLFPSWHCGFFHFVMWRIKTSNFSLFSFLFNLFLLKMQLPEASIFYVSSATSFWLLTFKFVCCFVFLYFCWK